MQTTEVLIIGAGPTGLVLALWLTKAGVKVRIVDKADKAGTTSRALVLHSRNLEFYHQLGINQLAIEDGIKIKAGNLWKEGKNVAHLNFGDLRTDITPYQFMLGYPQDKHEQMLEKQLAEIGVIVERNVELLSFENSGQRVIAQLVKQGQIEKCEALYLAGCDGASSVTRGDLEVGFPGGTYEETFYVADLICTGAFNQKELNIALDDADFLAIFPLKDSVRLVGTIRLEAKQKKDLKWEDVSENIIKRLKIEVQEVRWFSTYKVHHRVATHFRKDNTFLLGDAAHIHNPIGGQGMNTGIGDAVNLAWKMAAVLKDKAPAEILDTYEPERIAFANRLVATTDNAFTFVSQRGKFAKWVRLQIIPRLIPRLFQFTAVRRFLFRTISQTSIRYPKSKLSEGNAGKVKGGDRLPWVLNETGADNFESLKDRQWVIHVYGDIPRVIQELCNERSIKLLAFAWNTAAEKAGLKQNAVYVIRPDGYVGLADVNPEKVMTYLKKWGIGKS